MMEKYWIPLSIGIAFYGIYQIANRLGLYHLVEVYLQARTGTRGLTRDEFGEVINQLKCVVNVTPPTTI